MRQSETALTAACIETAIRIGARLCAQALWANGACTWNVVGSDRAPRQLVESAGPDIYRGTAGVGLFLTELYAVTGDLVAQRTALGALRFSASRASELRDASFGLHTGRVGIAHALARYASVTGDDLSRESARAILTPVFGLERTDQNFDVIAGGAGAIPVLLELAASLSLPQAWQCATDLGDNLIRSAHRWPEGWSWGTLVPGYARDLTGLAHGASGCGAALLELWAVTGEARFAYGAEQAFAYEAHHFDVDAANWPDFRSLKWAEIMQSPQERQALKQRLIDGAAAPRYEPVYMVAWCHGAAGIGLTRLRAYELLGNVRYADEARVATAATRGRLLEGPDNYSLCHGIFGNCELLIEAATRLGEPSLRSEVEAYVMEGIGAFERKGRAWPSGAFRSLPDPSLMLGEAGIGHFLLRLARPNVPSILFPVSPGSHSRGPAPSNASYDEFRKADADGYFGRTLRNFDRLGVTPGVRARARELGSTQPVIALAAAIDDAIAAELVSSPDTAPLLIDASRVDRARFAAMSTRPDLIDELAISLRRTNPDEIDWWNARVRLAPFVQLIECDRDWDAWLSNAPDAPQELPRASSSPTHVLFVHLGHVNVKALGRFPSLVLSLLADAGTEEWTTASGITTELLRDSAVVNAHRTVLPRVVEQLRRAHDAHIVVIDSSSARNLDISVRETPIRDPAEGGTNIPADPSALWIE